MRILALLSTIILSACSSVPKPPTVDGSNRQIVNSPMTAEMISLRAELAQSKTKLREEQARKTAPATSINNEPVIETGFADINAPVIKQAGNNKPLPEALRAILPPGWHARKKPNVDRELLISWDKGWDWTTTLNDVAEKYHLTISIDWNNKTVTVLNQERPKPLPIPVLPLRDSNKVFTVSTEKWDEIKPKTATAKDSAIPMPGKPTALPEKQAEPVKVVEKPLPPPVKISPPLRLVKGQWLKQCVENWTKEIGWNLAWSTTQDIQLEADSTFTGTPEEIAVKFEDSLHHGGFKLHVEGHRLNNTIEVVDI